MLPEDVSMVPAMIQLARGLSLRGSAVEGAKPELELWLRG